MLASKVSPFGPGSEKIFDAGLVDFAQLGSKFGYYELLEGIAFVPSVGAVQAKIIGVARELRETGIFEISELPWELISSEPIDLGLGKKVLELLGFDSMEGELWIKSSNYLDKAFAMLSLLGGASSVGKLAASIDKKISPRSFKQRLSTDSRFVFPDSGVVRIREAVDELGNFQTVKEILESLVLENGPPLSIEVLIEHIKSMRKVSERSIRAYASRYPFSLKAGLVSRDLIPNRPKAMPEKTRRLYRLSSGWAFRIEVTAEHLRGSSISLPMAAVNAFKLELEKQLNFADSTTDVPMWLKWTGGQPQARSIRANLMSANAEVGESFMCIFSSEKFSVFRIPLSNKTGLEALTEMFPETYGLSEQQFIYHALMCHELGKLPILDALRIRRERDLIDRFEGL
jgi:hypothetical protein